MYISYSLSKHLVVVHILALQLFTRSVSSLNLTNAYLHHKCFDKEGKYQPGSRFEKNLNQMTETLHTRLRDGDLISYDKPPSRVTIMFQCRGDSYGIKCRSCFATALAGLRRRCERNINAKIWYEQCFLHISQIDLLTADLKIDYENTFTMQNPKNVNGDTKSFNNKTTDLLHKLMRISIIPVNNRYVYYAAGEERVGANKLYAMVQCINGVGDCKICLESAIKELSKCCSGKQGARVYLGMSCNLRYEIYPFLGK